MAIIERLLAEYHHTLMTTPDKVLRPQQTVWDIFRPGNEAYTVDNPFTGYFIDEKPINIRDTCFEGSPPSLQYLYLESQFQQLPDHRPINSELLKYVLCTAHQGGLFGFIGMLIGEIISSKAINLTQGERRRCFFSSSDLNTLQVVEYCDIIGFQYIETGVQCTTNIFKVIITFSLTLLDGSIQIKDFDLSYTGMDQRECQALADPMTRPFLSGHEFELISIFQSLPLRDPSMPKVPLNEPMANPLEAIALHQKIRESIQNFINIAATPPRPIYYGRAAHPSSVAQGLNFSSGTQTEPFLPLP